MDPREHLEPELVGTPPRGRRVPRRPSGSGLRTLLVLLIVAPMLTIPFRDAEIDITDRMLAAAIWALCFVPAWRYLNTPRAKRPPVPFLPFIGLEFALYFALQAVIGSLNVYGRFEAMRLAPELDPALYDLALRLLGAGWCLVLLGYSLVPKRRRVRSALSVSDAVGFNAKTLIRVGFALCLAGFLFDYAKRLPGYPAELRGLLYFGAMLSLLGLSLLMMLSTRGLLSSGQRLGLYAIVLILGFFQAGTSATAQLVMLVLTLAFSVWVAKGRIPPKWVVAGALVAALAVTMRGTVNEYRKQTADLSEGMPVLQQSTMLARILSAHVATEGVGGAVASGWSAVAGRAALLDLFTDVIRQTPDVVPYWRGQTYLSLVGSFVPRFLWPNKPAKTLGYDFGHRYHYLLESDYSTTINLPYLVEFYANFGSLGVLLGMFVVGLVYGTVDRYVNVPGQGILANVIAIGFLMPLINVESDFSLVFGGVFLNGFALYMLAKMLRRQVNSRRRRPLGSGERTSQQQVA